MYLTDLQRQKILSSSLLHESIKYASGELTLHEHCPVVSVDLIADCAVVIALLLRCYALPPTGCDVAVVGKCQ